MFCRTNHDELTAAGCAAVGTGRPTATGRELTAVAIT